MQNKLSPCSPLHRRTLAVTLLTAVLAATTAHAANDLWIGNTDANFGTLGNWTGSVDPNGNTPEFGVAGTSGTTLNNDISSASYTGFLFDSGASTYTIGGNSFTLSGNVTNNSTSTQTINNDIVLSTNTNHTFSAASGQLTFAGNISGTIGSAANGGLILTPTTKITLSGTNNITFNTGITFLGFNVGAGAVDITGSTTIDGGSGSNNGGAVIGTNIGASNTSTLTIASGGSFRIKGSTAGAANTTPNSIIGQQSGTGVVNVGATDKSTSGTFTVDAGTGLLIGNSAGKGILNVNSGTATINRGTIATTTTLTDTRLIMMGKDNAGSTGTINLNGGTLATDRQFVRDGSTASGAGTANFVFNGGTLKALGTQTDWLQSTTASSAGQNQGATGGTVNTAALALSSVTTTAVSTIDANSFSVAINNAISGVGGFNINSSTGTGTVTFAGDKSYSGGTTITAGTLNTGASGTNLGSGNVTVNGGALTLNSTSIGNLTGIANFTMTTGTTSFDIVSLASFDSITGSGSFAINGGTIILSGTLVGDGTDSYAILSGFTGNTVGSFTFDTSGLSNLAGRTATLSNTGVLTFTAVPEPHEFAVAIAALLGVMVVIRRRNQRA